MALLDFSYQDISFEALNTPAQDWRILFKYMERQGLKTLFDAGAGHALSAEVATEFKSIHVTAWELDLDRIKGRSFHNQIVKQADLFAENIPKCDITFLYLPTGPLLERILSQLQENDLIAAVESHGELFDRLDEQCELVDELEITAKRHHPKLRIYRYHHSRDKLKSELRLRSFNPNFSQLLIREEDSLLGPSLWMADCYGLNITPDGFVETKFPERRFELVQVTNIVELINPDLIIERRSGKWRKIFVGPRAIVETPNGERIEIDGSKVALEQNCK